MLRASTVYPEDHRQRALMEGWMDDMHSITCWLTTEVGTEASGQRLSVSQSIFLCLYSLPFVNFMLCNSFFILINIFHSFTEAQFKICQNEEKSNSRLTVLIFFCFFTLQWWIDGISEQRKEVMRMFASKNVLNYKDLQVLFVTQLIKSCTELRMQCVLWFLS